MSLLGFEPRTPASLRTNLKDSNPYESDSYKSSALTRLSYRLVNDAAAAFTFLEEFLDI